jgi:hypothetical protein
MWLEQQPGTNRPLATAWWLAAVIVAQWSRLPLAAAIWATVRGAAGARVRVPPVSRAWLREHEVEQAKHEEG